MVYKITTKNLKSVIVLLFIFGALFGCNSNVDKTKEAKAHYLKQLLKESAVMVGLLKNELEAQQQLTLNTTEIEHALAKIRMIHLHPIQLTILVISDFSDLDHLYIHKTLACLNHYQKLIGKKEILSTGMLFEYGATLSPPEIRNYRLIINQLIAECDTFLRLQRETLSQLEQKYPNTNPPVTGNPMFEYIDPEILEEVAEYKFKDREKQRKLKRKREQNKQQEQQEQQKTTDSGVSIK